MTLLTDTFDRADTTSGLGLIPGTQLAWQTILGTSKITANKPVLTKSGANAIVGVTTGSGDADVTVPANGGDCVYLRILNATNWVRARIRRWTTSETYYTYGTRYTYIAHFGTAPGNLTKSGSQQNPVSTSHTHSNDAQNVQTFSQSCPVAASYSHSHQVYDEWGTPWSISHTHNRISCALMTGMTEYNVVTGSYQQSTTHYQCVIELSINDVITVLDTDTISSPGTLRFAAGGASLAAYVGGSGTPASLATSDAHATALTHGFGLGASEVVSSLLDTVTLDLIVPARGLQMLV